MKARYQPAKFVLPAILALAGPACIAPARAQVSVDTHALDSLQSPPPANKSTPHRARARSRTEPTRPEQARTESAARPDLPLPVPPLPPGAAEAAQPAGNAAQGAPPAQTTAAVPPIPSAPPAPARVGPPETPPPLAALPPPPIPVAKDAPGDATAIPQGLRVTFGADRADLNDQTAAALHDFARTAKADANTPVNVLAHAQGMPQDPSTPRRLALSRALAARAVLINEGIPSTRIYVRALGPLEIGDGPVNRVDLILGRPAAAEAESQHPGQAGSASADTRPASGQAAGQNAPAPNQAPAPSPAESTPK